MQEETLMGDDKNKVSDKASEIARNIWLAGIGAYGRAVGEAQDRLGKAGVETPKLFRDLVKAGAALEEDTRSALSAGQEARQSVEERINRVRENFSLQRWGHSDDLQALHDKIDQLNAKVDALAEALSAGSPPRKPGATGSAKRTAGARKKAASSTGSSTSSGPKAARKSTGTRAATSTGKSKARKKAPAPAKKAGARKQAATKRSSRQRD
jgi:hypothetical protein